MASVCWQCKVIRYNLRYIGNDERGLRPGLAHGLDPFHTSLSGSIPRSFVWESFMGVLDILIRIWMNSMVMKYLVAKPFTRPHRVSHHRTRQESNHWREGKEAADSQDDGTAGVLLYLIDPALQPYRFTQVG